MMAGAGTATPRAASPPWASRPCAICVAMKLLPVSMRGPKRSMIVWNRPDAPVSKIGSTMTTPSAWNISKASQSKSSLWTHMFLVPLMSIFTQVMQPVQCLMSRSIARMNSTSQPCFCAARSTALQMVSLLPFLVPNETPTILVMATPFLSGQSPTAAPPRRDQLRGRLGPKPLGWRIDNRTTSCAGFVLNHKCAGKKPEKEAPCSVRYFSMPSMMEAEKLSARRSSPSFRSMKNSSRTLFMR